MKLGLESENEEASILLTLPVAPDEFKLKLQPQLPEGIRIKDASGNFN
ncbi:MAG: DUF2344 domain-containing protein [Candidatus Omnitrophica bacterium]|nr:DUF2344 domain-containing protein [Candidatus Omnitrophota bacterium]